MGNNGKSKKIDEASKKKKMKKQKILKDRTEDGKWESEGIRGKGTALGPHGAHEPVHRREDTISPYKNHTA